MQTVQIMGDHGPQGLGRDAVLVQSSTGRQSFREKLWSVRDEKTGQLIDMLIAILTCWSIFRQGRLG